jgi:hypothetical protein
MLVKAKVGFKAFRKLLAFAHPLIAVLPELRRVLAKDGRRGLPNCVAGVGGIQVVVTRLVLLHSSRAGEGSVVVAENAFVALVGNAVLSTVFVVERENVFHRG